MYAPDEGQDLDSSAYDAVRRSHLYPKHKTLNSPFCPAPRCPRRARGKTWTPSAYDAVCSRAPPLCPNYKLQRRWHPAAAALPPSALEL